MAILVKDQFKEVVGLKNDIVWKVFVCPECKTEVTISRYQAAGDLPIMCARCNARWQVQGDQILDQNKDKSFMNFKVFIKLDEVQKNPPKPKPAAAPAAPGAAPAAKPAAPATAVPASPKPEVAAPANTAQVPAATPKPAEPMPPAAS
jgi:hypothetical protein